MADRTTRPVVPLTHPDPDEHRRQLAIRANASLPKDGTEGATAPLRLMSFAVADLPDASLWTGAIVFVSDEAGGAVPAWSDGTNWKRFSDGTNVSS